MISCLLRMALVSLLIVAPVSDALAHGGGLNSEGCHNETATGGYHCHRNKDDDEDSVDWLLVGGVAAGAVAAWLLYDWLCSDDPAVADRLHLVPRLTEGEAGFVAEYALDGAQSVGFRARTYTDEREETYMGALWRVTF